MKKNRLDQYKSSLLQIAEKYGVSQVYVFGSVARGEDSETSDVDFLIEMKEDASALGVGGFQFEAETLLGTPVDVVPTFALEETQDNGFADAIRAEAVLL